MWTNGKSEVPYLFSPVESQYLCQKQKLADYHSIPMVLFCFQESCDVRVYKREFKTLFSSILPCDIFSLPSPLPACADQVFIVWEKIYKRYKRYSVRMKEYWRERRRAIGNRWTWRYMKGISHRVSSDNRQIFTTAIYFAHETTCAWYIHTHTHTKETDIHH